VRVLLADDEPSVRSALRLILEQQADIEVAGEANDADNLLKWLTANRTDVLLVDWELPGISGKELVTILHTLAPEMQIIVLNSSPQTRQPALQAGARDFVSKGEPPEVLLAALENMRHRSDDTAPVTEVVQGIRDLGLSGFKRVSVMAAIKLELVYGDTYRVTTSDEDYDYIRAEKNDETLSITRRGFSWSSLFRNLPRVMVTMPELNEIVATGACRVDLKGFHTPRNLSIELLGASHLEISDFLASDVRVRATGACRMNGSQLSFGYINADISGASRIVLSGSANNVNLRITGASTADLDEFKVTDVDINMSGGSHATINTDGRLNAHLSGASNLAWLGKPVLGDIEITGASQIHRK